nr:hypothetical protein [Tanacetum cinerariifolium]
MTLGEVNTKATKLAELYEHDTQDIFGLLEDAQDSRTPISQRVTIDSQWVDLLIEDRTAHQETILEAYTAREAWAHSIGLSQAVHSELQTHREQGISKVGYCIRDTWVNLKEAVPEIAPMTLGELVDLLMMDRIAHQETILIVEEEAYAAREAWAHLIGLSQVVHFELQTYREQTEMAEFRETGRRRQAQMVEILQVMGDMRREMGGMQAELLALRERIMAPVTRQGSNAPPNDTNPNNMTPESVQAMIDQAFL